MRPVVLVALLVGCKPEDSTEGLEKAIERALGDCTYTYEGFDEDGVVRGLGRGAYDESGDPVLDELFDLTTGEPSVFWEATYAEPHRIATQREWNIYDDPPPRLETFTYDDAGRLVLWEVDATGDDVTDGLISYSYDETGDVVVTEGDTNGDGVPETVVTETSAWTETDEGWTVDIVQEDADGNVTTQQLRLDRAERLLYRLIEAGGGDYRSETLIEGYGALEWATHEVQETTSGSGRSVIDTVRDLDDGGRYVSSASSWDSFDADGQLRSSLAWSETRVWSCP